MRLLFCAGVLSSIFYGTAMASTPAIYETALIVSGITKDSTVMQNILPVLQKHTYNKSFEEMMSGYARQDGWIINKQDVVFDATGFAPQVGRSFSLPFVSFGGYRAVYAIDHGIDGFVPTVQWINKPGLFVRESLAQISQDHFSGRLMWNAHGSSKDIQRDFTHKEHHGSTVYDISLGESILMTQTYTVTEKRCGAFSTDLKDGSLCALSFVLWIHS